MSDERAILESLVSSLNSRVGKDLPTRVVEDLAEEYNQRLESLELPIIQVAGEDNSGTTRQLVTTLMLEGIDENFARERVRNLIDQGVDISKMIGCSAQYDKVTDSINIFDRLEGRVQTITEWAGELNHSISETMILVSLIYDSGYSLKDLGIE